MRFHEEQVALSADIESMFNQVAVPQHNRSVLRFLWSESPTSEKDVYQYTCHIFGVKCALTCANYALIRNARDNQAKYPEAATALEWNFYMDDFFKSVESKVKAVELHHQLVNLLNIGHFHLTKWISNVPEVIKEIPEIERAPSVKVVKTRSSCQ